MVKSEHFSDAAQALEKLAQALAEVEPEMVRNNDPAFVAKREDRRQMGIAAKKVRVLPLSVNVGRDCRQRFNADRRHKDY